MSTLTIEDQEWDGSHRWFWSFENLRWGSRADCVVYRCNGGFYTARISWPDGTGECYVNAPTSFDAIMWAQARLVSGITTFPVQVVPDHPDKRDHDGRGGGRYFMY